MTAERSRPRQAVRVLSWNVNGLRACVQRFGGSINNMLNHLDADIVCFQETKMRRCDLDRELALADDWESFFAFNRGPTGYSGVATYCRHTVGLPIAAEEGLTGVLALQPALRSQALQQPLWQGQSVADLMALDQEGRVVITDHGQFVLLNWYGVAITSDHNADERIALKLRLCRAVEARTREWLEAGRRVLVVGDLNISPKPQDFRQPEPLDSWYSTSPSRTWLRDMLWDGPIMRQAAAAAAAATTSTATAGISGRFRPQGALGSQRAWASHRVVASGDPGVGVGSRAELVGARSGALEVGRAPHGRCVPGHPVKEEGMWSGAEAGGGAGEGALGCSVAEGGEGGEHGNRGQVGGDWRLGAVTGAGMHKAGVGGKEEWVAGGVDWEVQPQQGSGEEEGEGGERGEAGRRVEACEVEGLREGELGRSAAEPGGRGVWVDTFRLFHPHRQSAFTCWSTASGARVNNWGSRIDLCLAAGPGPAAGPQAVEAVGQWVVAADIWPELQGSDHAPAWVDVHLPALLPAAPTQHLAGDPTDPASLLAQPPLATQPTQLQQPLQPPPLSTRWMFSAVRQRKLDGWLAGPKSFERQQQGQQQEGQGQQQGQQLGQQQEQQQLGQQQWQQVTERLVNPRGIQGGLGAAGQVLADTLSAPASNSSPLHHQQRLHQISSAQRATNTSAKAEPGPPTRGGVLFSAGPATSSGSSSRSNHDHSGSSQETVRRQAGGRAAGAGQRSMRAFMQLAPQPGPLGLVKVGGGGGRGALPGRLGQPGPLLALGVPPTPPEPHPPSGSQQPLGLARGSQQPQQPQPQQQQQPSQQQQQQQQQRQQQQQQQQQQQSRQQQQQQQGSAKDEELLRASEARQGGSTAGSLPANLEDGSRQGTGEAAGTQLGGPMAAGGPVSADSQVGVVAAWRTLQDRMKPPLCKGHQKPCVIRQVKKAGQNCGRSFYVCALPDGPPPVGRCDFFAWASSRQADSSKRPLTSSAVSAKKPRT